MGLEQNVKFMRKQIRNVAKEHYQNALTHESIESIRGDLSAIINSKIDEIAENAQGQITEINSRNQQFQRALLDEARSQISRELAGIAVSVMAIQEVLAEKLNLDGFLEDVETRKKVIFERANAEAKAAFELAQKEKEEKLKQQQSAENLEASSEVDESAQVPNNQ